jgi:8-oxo-dGTP diphosphatase
MKTIHVVAALIPHPTEPSTFLVQQRPANKSRANLWEFPGGKVEPGESNEAALARECREELEVEVTVGARRWGTVHTYADLTVHLELYAATIVRGAPKPVDAQALKFASIAEMQRLPFCEADLPLIEALASGTV